MDMINWVLALVMGSIALNIPKIATLSAILISGLFGAYLMAFIFRPYSIGFLGNTFFGLIGGFVGAYYFLSKIYNIMPMETSLINLDNDINIDVLVGLAVGGLLGGFLLAFIIGFLRTMVFGSKASA